ncbi:MAG: PLP-dependent aminotransferase family protein, partial [Acidiferrobacterales bacterium]
MRDQLLHLPPDGSASLQAQIRELLVSAILDGHIPSGSALPSCRKLALQLGVARNTVVLAYQQLVDEGYLISRERSGYYVNKDILAGRVARTPRAQMHTATAPDWSTRLKMRPSSQRNIVKPHDWQRYPYPFIYGQLDPALFPIADWRECAREALSVVAIRDWARDRIDSDDSLLIEQIHTRLLPRRGVWASPDEILVTVGAQHALYLLATLLVTSGSTVGIEDPGYPDARNIFAVKTSRMVGLPVDEAGLIVDKNLDRCDYIYVTPSHQSPTTVTQSLQRRQSLLRHAMDRDFVVIEDDYECETNFVGDPTPALKSLDENNRVIYVGSVSKTLAPGLRLGYMVAPTELIREARALRRLMLRH